jgi:hypothetical protein
MNFTNTRATLRWQLALFASVCLAASALPGAVAPVSSSISLTAWADAGAGSVQNNKSVQQTTALNPLSTSVLAQALNGNVQATTTSDGAASWSSASSFQLTLHTRFSCNGPGCGMATGSAGWFYTFNSDQAATLTLNYQFTQTGPYGYGLRYVLNESTPDVLHQLEFYYLPASGAASFALDPGVDYTLQLFDNSNLYQNPDPYTTDLTGNFSFNITPVPESQGVFLLGVVILGIGCGRRGVAAVR